MGLGIVNVILWLDQSVIDAYSHVLVYDCLKDDGVLARDNDRKGSLLELVRH